jgi:hypothetical protein
MNTEKQIKKIMVWLDEHDPCALTAKGEELLRMAEKLDARSYFREAI